GCGMTVGWVEQSRLAGWVRPGGAGSGGPAGVQVGADGQLDGFLGDQRGAVDDADAVEVGAPAEDRTVGAATGEEEVGGDLDQAWGQPRGVGRGDEVPFLRGVAFQESAVEVGDAGAAYGGAAPGAEDAVVGEQGGDRFGGGVVQGGCVAVQVVAGDFHLFEAAEAFYQGVQGGVCGGH